MKTPRAGTVLRAVFDAEHAIWCGPDCAPSCREWHPNYAVMTAVIEAVRAYDAVQRDTEFVAAMVAEVGLAPDTDTFLGQPVEWLWPNFQCSNVHAYVKGAGSGDTSLCGVPLTPDGAVITVFATDPECKRCRRHIDARQTAPRFCGSNPDRQSVGLPGHCEKCATLGHVLAHPNLGCGDVWCDRAHNPGEF